MTEVTGMSDIWIKKPQQTAGTFILEQKKRSHYDFSYKLIIQLIVLLSLFAKSQQTS